MMAPQASNKDSKRIKELMDKISDVEERVGRNTQDLQKLKDVKEKQKHLANLIDKKADLELLKKLQAELGKVNFDDQIHLTGPFQRIKEIQAD